MTELTTNLCRITVEIIHVTDTRNLHENLLFISTMKARKKHFKNERRKMFKRHKQEHKKIVQKTRKNVIIIFMPQLTSVEIDI